MEKIQTTIIVSETEIGQRIDQFVASKHPEFSRSYVQKLIKNEEVTVNGKIVKSNYKLVLNDEIIFNIPEPEELNIEP